MSTSTKTHQTGIDFSATKTSERSEAFWKMVEFNRYGIISMLLIVIVCLGGIAAGLGAVGNALQIFMVSLPTAVTLSFVLAVSPMKTIVYSSVIAIILDILVMII